MRRVQKPDTFKNIFTFKERERKRTWKRNRQRNSCIYLKKKKSMIREKIIEKIITVEEKKKI